ncbi:cytochrome P450 [Artomyces pyxidatus]|uniref:Cytochrome P450 n=1 Tax=Artomyces pyxidatus TaxID=48021 RepID=A0ACB8SRI2_9AGAM|nr:cytochrome P450 [Artomyces pyxidatus]
MFFRRHDTIAARVFHCNTSDDVYQGMFIPKGSCVLANLAAMLQDEAVYPEPDTLNPDRFALGADGSECGPDPARSAFGFGRRICPGRFFAGDTIWLTVANILHLFRLEKKVDSTGNIVEPRVTWSTGLVSVPSFFDCDITPRLAGAESLIPGLE